MTEEFPYYSCVRVEDLRNQPPDDDLIEAPCDAGCGKKIVYPHNLRDGPKICRTCTNWVMNPAGSA